MSDTHHFCPKCGSLTANVECVDMEVETLRDKFAMAALTGMLANGGYEHEDIEINTAEVAYLFADQMMAERKNEDL